jgi:drug/metabolite transporter (DMT)-like permease
LPLNDSNKSLHSVLNQRAFLALVLGGIAIGFSPIFVRLAEVGPSASAFWRVTLALPLFWFWVLQEKGPKQKGHPTTLQDYKVLLFCGFFFFLDLALWHWSLQFTTVSNATLLSNLMPAFVAIGAFFIFKERLGRVFYIGLLLSVLGAGLLAGNSFEAAPERLLGDGLAVLTAITYAGYMLVISWLRGRFTTAVVMFWTGAFSAIFLGSLSVISNEVFLPTIIEGWLPLLGLAFVSQFSGQGLIVYGLRHLPPSFGAVTLLIQPIIAAAVAWPLFDESLGLMEFFGGIIILSGIYLARFGAIKNVDS